MWKFDRALGTFASFLLVAFAAINAVRLAQSARDVFIGLQPDDRLYPSLLYGMVVASITLAAAVLLFKRRPLGWFFALTVSIYKFLSISGLHAFSFLALGPDSLPRGWFLGVALWLAISLILLHPRVRHACEIESGISFRIAGAAVIAVALTALAFLTPGWDFRSSS